MNEFQQQEVAVERSLICTGIQYPWMPFVRETFRNHPLKSVSHVKPVLDSQFQDIDHVVQLALKFHPELR